LRFVFTPQKVQNFMFHTGVYLYIAGPAADVMGKNMKRGEKTGENEGEKRKDKGNVEGKRVK
jgi:hypothetical protein